ncbi:response regulator transcription factor [Chloroflexi bacterium]|nr:DNA-binding response regulator [Chloroflexota bacterium]MDC0252862.1 response regulator transcription factor [Chloroflexota bacterium]RZP14368.1 MAG: response regulator transcription factor [Chloroflexota bacterium]|tara:strand:+ start:213 stop:893 length:681 start_codon:yes stop_codon:yes gene_type:complete
MNEKILICDDDPIITESLSEYLLAMDYKVFSVNDGEKAVEKFKDFSPDLVLLDIMMPNLNGLQVTKIIREKSEVPIIFLTAKISVDEKILGFELGADDYMTKPFSMRELLLRIQAVLKRNNITKNDSEQIFEKGNLSIFSLKREVNINDFRIDLTKTEFDFLECFIKNFENVLSRDQLLEYTKYDYLDSDDRVVDVHIKNLRKKLEENNSDIKILTVRGMGYRAST